MAQRVVCVVGPTASGKTKMGVALAKRFNGEVVSVDSMQIYRGMAIGTAAPTPEETEGVPHHMIGVADPAESWSVSRFTQEADRCIQDILRRGKLPILVGGTGLYLDALVRGNTFAAGQQGGAVRRELQARLAQEGAAALLAELAAVDPETAARLHLRDEKRILRALEVYRETGETISEHDRKSRETPDRYDALYIGLSFRDRQDLRDRIDRRVDVMVEQGLLDEVQALLNAVRPLPHQRLILAFQPHTYSRTHELFRDFVDVLKLPDKTILAEIYAAREKNELGISSRDLAARIPGAVYCATLEQVADELAQLAQPGDMILTVGAGDIYRAGEMLLERGDAE